MVLSSLQLFIFGIFLPHRKRDPGLKDESCTRSIHLPVFWSFITCYHFGYHQEHHFKSPFCPGISYLIFTKPVKDKAKLLRYPSGLMQTVDSGQRSGLAAFQNAPGAGSTPKPKVI